MAEKKKTNKITGATVSTSEAANVQKTITSQNQTS
jgi:hypothetical protein